MKIKDLLFKSPTEQINNEIDSYRLLYEPFFRMLFLCFICLCNHILWGTYGCIALFYLIAYEFSMIRIRILSRKCPFKEIKNADLKERFCSVGYSSEKLSSYPSAFLRCGCAYKKRVLFSGSVDKIPFVCECLGIDKKGNSVSSISATDAPFC